MEQQLAWSCAARILQHCGHGAELRRLATVPGFGRELGWEQALGALSVCTQALRATSAGGASDSGLSSTDSDGAKVFTHEIREGAAMAAVQEDEKWRSRFLFCAASLPLVLQLVERAEWQPCYACCSCSHAALHMHTR